LRYNVFSRVVVNCCIVAMLAVFGFLTVRGSVVAVSGSKSDEIFYRGNESLNNMALMINVYWGNEHLPQMLSTLQEKGVRCTFFIGGSWAAENHDLLRKLHQDGHELGNHGYHHKSPSTISDERNREEILVTERLIESIVGVRTTLFAPPSGDVNKKVASLASEMGYRTVMWTQDTIDWRDQDVDLIVKRATARAANGNLVLMHPTLATRQALPKIIDRLRELGYNLTTVSNTIWYN